MTNHIHLLVHVPDGGLADAVHRFAGRYASAFNGWTERTGRLSDCRYFGEPITSNTQLTQTARHIHRNPLAFLPPGALISYR